MLITSRNYYAELWKHTRTRVNALFVAAITLDGTSRGRGPSGEGSATWGDKEVALKT